MKKILTVTILLVLLLTACTVPWQWSAEEYVKTQNSELTLEVALYSYFPDPAAFRQAVRDAWTRVPPDVGLHFADWDCYVSDPDQALDVFVFDAIYLSSFVDEGYLLPIPEEIIRNREDLIPLCPGRLPQRRDAICSAADGSALIFSIPRKEDSDLTGVSDLVALYDVLGDRKSQSVIPEENEGLLINLSDVLLTKTMMYLDALMDEQQGYTDYSELPSETDLSAQALERLEYIWKMGGYEQVSYWPEDNDPFFWARWFADGKGRAYIGYAEAMNAMGDYADDVILRRLSYGTRHDIPLFYSDVVGISSAVSEEKKAAAFELANLLTSGEVLTAMSLPGEEGGSPQYLLTSRRAIRN